MNKFKTQLATAYDYREFQLFCFVLDRFGNYDDRVKYVEIGSSRIWYYAVLYTGEKPTRDEIIDMLNKHNVIIEGYNDEQRTEA